MENKLIKFLAKDGVTLNGYLHKGKLNTNKMLIEVHGMTSNCFKKREDIIAKNVEKVNVDTICFNTRGSEIVKYITDVNGNKKLAGTAYEDIEEAYLDILGAIEYSIKLGYKSIYLQGHSLGATKVVYTYNKMKKEDNEYLPFIKGIILLSLVDIPDMLKTYCDSKYIDYAKEKYEKGETMDLMPSGSFIHPISIKTFLKYLNNRDIDFAQFSQPNNEFEVLNSFDIPIFMRWGNINELIKKNIEEQVKFMNIKIKNSKKNISYISGANHSYDGKEEILAYEICDFLKDI